MAISNTRIQIKRSSTTATPSGLNAGELAYSYLSNTLFLGNSTGTGVVNIGGLLYTQTIDNATNNATALTLVKRDASGNASFNYVIANVTGSITGSANSATYLNYPQNFSISGGDISATSVAFGGNNAVTLNASLNSIAGLTAGTYGGSTAVPVVTVAANGRIMAISNTTISTSLTVTGNTGTTTPAGGSVLEFIGNTNSGITTQITANGSGANVVFSTDNTFLRSNTTTGVGTVQTISTDLTVAGNLVVSGTQTFVNTSTVVTNDSLIKLAANNYVADVIDIGFYGESNTGSSIAYHGIIREGSGGTNAGDFYVFKNLATDPTGNTVSYASLQQANLRANIISSNVTATNLYISGTANLATLNVSSTANISTINVTNPSTFGNTTMAVVNTSFMNATSIQANSINIGTLTYAASGLFAAFAANTNNYQQVILQNSNPGNNASADFIVSNLNSTDGFLYGDFGINGPGFTGTGALSTANNVYLYASNTDLAIGTSSANAIHFVVNGGATDAMTINSNGVVTLGTALSVPYGGTGSSTFTTGQRVVYSGTSLVSQANTGTPIATGSLQAYNTITSLTFNNYGEVTAYTSDRFRALLPTCPP